MSTPADVAIMDQVAVAAKGAAAFTPLSPLDHVREMGLEPQSASDNSSSTVTLIEKPVQGLLVLRGDQSRVALSAALKKVALVELPDTLQSTESGDYCARWMSPNEWLVSCPLNEAFELEGKLREAVSEPVAIVNVSGGFSSLELSGPDALNILKKSTGYDVDERHFPPGKVVNTTFAKAQVTLRALPEGAYELLVRRSFADYVFLWIQRAGKEYGLKTVIG